MPPNAPLILVVGRIDPQKGQGTAVEALERLPDAVLALVGGVTNDGYFQELQAQVEARGLKDRVRIVPGYPRGDRRLWDAYAAADVVVLPSRHEPFGIVVLEAWSMGKPVVATCVGGLRDLIEDGVDGRSIPPNDPSALAEALADTLGQEGRGAARGERGRQKVLAQYTWDAVTQRLLNLYRELIDERSVRS